MKYALISPNEIAQTGYRVADTSINPFEVASPLFWVECADEVITDVYWYDPTNGSFKLTPILEPEPFVPQPQPISEGAQTL